MASPLNGLCEVTIKGKPAVVEHEPDPELRDTEQIPLLHEGGIDAFLEKEVLPYAPDAWYLPAQVKIGYEISFTRHFYKPKPMRSLDEIRADIIALERGIRGAVGGDSGEMSDTKTAGVYSTYPSYKDLVTLHGMVRRRAGTLGNNHDAEILPCVQ